MDESKLKLKHIYNLHKYSPSYPTEEDVLYELITILERKDLVNKEFDDRILRGIQIPKTYSSNVEMMNYFVGIGYFELVKTFKKTNTELTLYKLLNHPWQ